MYCLDMKIDENLMNLQINEKQRAFKYGK